MASEPYPIFGPSRIFCSCGSASCPGDCNLLPVEDVSDLIDAGVWEVRHLGAPPRAASRQRVGKAVQAPSPASDVSVEDAADFYAAGVWDHKLT